MTAPDWHYSGFPTESGRYVCSLGRGRNLVLSWDVEGRQRDWREGAVRVNGIRAFYGPIPPPKREKRPELHPARAPAAVD